jgi:cell wall-associated NlpC family hydrolase
LRRTTLPALLLAALLPAAAASSALAEPNGGAAPTSPNYFDPGQLGGAIPPPPDTVGDEDSGPVASTATLHGGVAEAPAGAPSAVKEAIDAANQIRHKPYVWGGGHGSFKARGYDCSGSVSYVLHAAGLIDSPEVSGALESWGTKGRGDWITVYANSGHAYMVIAGLRFDTSGAGGSGPRWRSEGRSPRGYRVRHARGL